MHEALHPRSCHPLFTLAEAQEALHQILEAVAYFHRMENGHCTQRPQARQYHPGTAQPHPLGVRWCEIPVGLRLPSGGATNKSAGTLRPTARPLQGLAHSLLYSTRLSRLPAFQARRLCNLRLPEAARRPRSSLRSTMRVLLPACNTALSQRMGHSFTSTVG